MKLEFIFGTDNTKTEIQNEKIQLFLKSRALGKCKVYDLLDTKEVTESSSHELFFTNQEVSGGIYIQDFDQTLEKQTYHIYRDILERTQGFNLYRTYNFIPEITGFLSQEPVYEMFNAGRLDAFLEFSGKSKKIMPPASTGIDILGDKMVIVFLATKNPVQYFSNPLQVNSYEYPENYGKKSPFFSRAVKTKLDGKEVLLISGTASIRESESVFIGDVTKQTVATIENITELIKQSGLNNTPEKNHLSYSKLIYIKDPSNLNKVQNIMHNMHFLDPKDIFLQANVCRKELEIEICLSLSVSQ